MKKDEKGDWSARQLQTLERFKFENDGIREFKELMKRFLATVTNNVAEYVNMKRKDK